MIGRIRVLEIYPMVHIFGLTDMYPESSGVAFEPHQMKVDCSIFLKNVPADVYKAATYKCYTEKRGY